MEVPVGIYFLNMLNSKLRIEYLIILIFLNNIIILYLCSEAKLNLLKHTNTCDLCLELQNRKPYRYVKEFYNAQGLVQYQLFFPFFLLYKHPYNLSHDLKFQKAKQKLQVYHTTSYSLHDLVLVFQSFLFLEKIQLRRDCMISMFLRIKLLC